MNIPHTLITTGIAFLLWTGASEAFVHPGVYNNAAELNFIRDQVHAGEEPWATAYKEMMSKATGKGKVYASLDWEPTPHATVQRGGTGNVDYYIDAMSAYVHALIWIISGEKAHAEKAMEILNAWSSTFKTVTVVGSYNKASHKLITGWAGGTFAAAAELLRYSNAGWSKADIDQCEQFTNRMYNIIKSGDPKKNGNWDASMIRSMLAIAVFTNDNAKWDHAKNYLFKKSSNGSLPGYIKPSGESQETCRDHHHSQMGIGELVQACEIGWKQGEDWYSYQDNLLAKGCEYTARVLNGVAQNSGCGSQSCPNCIVYPLWEMAVNHYANRANVDVPYSQKCAEKIRPSSNWWSSMFVWQTLTHYGLPSLPKGYDKEELEPPSPAPIPDPAPTVTRKYQVQPVTLPGPALSGSLYMSTGIKQPGAGLLSRRAYYGVHGRRLIRHESSASRPTIVAPITVREN